MPVAYPDRRSNLRALMIVAALLIFGSGVYFILRSKSPDETKQSAADPAPSSDMTPTVGAPKAPMDMASRSLPASLAASIAPRPAPQWQASLMPAVVAATRVESLTAFQVQMEKWSCEGERCVSNLRIPLNTDAGRKHDISAPADILDVLQKKLAQADIQVAVRSIQPDSQGVAVSLEFSPNASSQGRFYTDAEIAAIRMESIKQGLKMNSQSTAH